MVRQIANASIIVANATLMTQLPEPEKQPMQVVTISIKRLLAGRIARDRTETPHLICPQLKRAYQH
jgi:hypothetical protein